MERELVHTQIHPADTNMLEIQTLGKETHRYVLRVLRNPIISSPPSDPLLQ